MKFKEEFDSQKSKGTEGSRKAISQESTRKILVTSGLAVFRGLG